MIGRTCGNVGELQRRWFVLNILIIHSLAQGEHVLNDMPVHNWSCSNLFKLVWFCSVHDTVGAVALDAFGNVACATSTGGIRNKMVGRVGDSPCIGELFDLVF